MTCFHVQDSGPTRSLKGWVRAGWAKYIGRGIRARSNRRHQGSSDAPSGDSTLRQRFERVASHLQPDHPTSACCTTSAGKTALISLHRIPGRRSAGSADWKRGPCRWPQVLQCADPDCRCARQGRTASGVMHRDFEARQHHANAKRGQLLDFGLPN